MLGAARMIVAIQSVRQRSYIPSLCIVVGILLLGCQKPMTTADVQGIWVTDGTSAQIVKQSGGCQIKIQADGAFSATVPDYLMVTPDKAAGKTMAGNGQWAIQDGELKLAFGEVDGQRINWGATPLKHSGSGSSSVLWFYIGEEGGRRFVFHRNE